MTPVPTLDRAAWIRRFSTGAGDTRLVCFPHAGGSASYFFWLTGLLEPRIDTLAVQYPGRQDRLREPCAGSIGELAESIVAALEDWSDLPYCFLGHSMGAVVAYETARLLRRRGRPGPVRLFASGRRAPSAYRPGDVHTRDDEGLIAELLLLGGTDETVLRDPHIRSMALRPTRGDYRAIETYRHEPGEELDCPVTVLTGDDDPHTTLPEAEAWRRHTSGRFELCVFPGGHFFLDRHRVEVADMIRAQLGGAYRERSLKPVNESQVRQDAVHQNTVHQDAVRQDAVEVLLCGGPAEHLPHDERVCNVPDGESVIKLPRGAHYDHYAPTAQRIRRDGRELRVFAWSHRTFVAE